MSASWAYTLAHTIGGLQVSTGPAATPSQIPAKIMTFVDQGWEIVSFHVEVDKSPGQFENLGVNRHTTEAYWILRRPVTTAGG